MSKGIPYFDSPTDFSLVQGGPLFQLLVSTGLLKPPCDMLTRRIVAAIVVTWLPLGVLAAFSGTLLTGAGVPFLLDIGAHSRLLLAIPLLIFAEALVHQRLKVTVRQFLDRDLVRPEDYPRFEGLIASSMRMRNSIWAEVLLLAIAIVFGQMIGERYMSIQGMTWYSIQEGGVTRFTPAGYWYVFVSLTLLRFLLLRWLFRLVVWYYFLGRVAFQIPLQLNALHPDRSGGLGFLAGSVHAFVPLLLAQTVMLSGIVGGKIWHDGATLPEFKVELTAWMIVLMLLVLTPLTFFMKALADARRAGMREYGLVASRYVNDFRRKWIVGSPGEGEPLLGAADIQSLADLSNSFEVVQDMRLVPIGYVTVIRIAMLIALLLAPLALTMIPVDQLIDRLLGLLL